MLSSSLLVLLGFVLLMAGAEYAVRGAVAIANKLKIPALIVGLTIVALGTSAPEFVVSMRAALKDAEGITVGNIVGSNIANILLILGAAAVIYPVSCVRHVFLRDYAFLFLVTAIFTLFAMEGTLVRWQGILMLSLLLLFVVYNYFTSKANAGNEDENVSPLAERSWALVIFVSVSGLAAIVWGADLLVDGAVSLARLLGVSEEVIGLTIIAFGTSLPELATSCMAAFRHQTDVALGNVIGSNIWNIVFIMGAVCTVTVVEVPAQFLFYDIWIMVLATVLLLPFMYSDNKLSRIEGFVFVLLYLCYIVSLGLFSKGMISLG